VVVTQDLAVIVGANRKTLACAIVPLNASKYEIQFSLSSLTSQMDAYNISCSDSYAEQIFVNSGRAEGARVGYISSLLYYHTEYTLLGSLS
jgi:hypothetical protein